MLGSRRMRRCGVAVAIAGMLLAGGACEPTPAPSDQIEVTRLTFPDGSPMSEPRAMNERGEVATCRAGGECYIWQDGDISVIAHEDARVFVDDLSDRGHAIGRVVTDDTQEGFLWDDGELTILPKGGAPQAWLSEVNDHGVVVGSLTHDGRSEAVAWRDGQLVRVPENDWLFASAIDINNRNQVLIGGWVADPENVQDGYNLSAIWDLDTGEIIRLGTFGGESTRVSGINGRGMVIGESETADGEQHAFLWDRSEMIDLGTLGGGWSRTNDLNEWGQVVGISRNADGEMRAFQWHKGEMTELGAGTTDPWPLAINNWGQAVGTIRAEDTGLDEAVLWQNGRMLNLGDAAREALPDNSPKVPTRAEYINDRGQVAGELNLVPISGHDAILWEVSPTWGYYPDGLTP